MSILLTTLNARYSHPSLGLRYILANMGDLKPRTQLLEFIIGNLTTNIVEQLLAHQPRIIGISVAIWNIEESTKLVALLKKVAPEVTLIVGGPEVWHETEEQEIARLADYVMTGQGDLAFTALCQQILNGETGIPKIVHATPPDLKDLQFPYDEYTDEDIAQRTIYVEASRGCPFKCAFCLSALDKTARKFDTDLFLAEMEKLHARGLRRFKFVDRTFNLQIKDSLRIMQFFLDKLDAFPDDPVFAHFEVIPDHLPSNLREAILKFPAGTLQLEIGIQTFNEDVQTRINRRQDNEKSDENIRWLMTQTHAHLHSDLIAGLPGEDMASFANGFDRLIDIAPHEIQFGILKRLRGTPIIAHTEPFGLVFDPHPPYSILATNDINFETMQRLVRFARYWDLVGNSGRFKNTLPLILSTSPFARFMAFSDWLYAKTGATHQIALARLANLVIEWLSLQGTSEAEAQTSISSDYAGGARYPHLSRPKKKEKGTPKRQSHHIATEPTAQSG